MIKIIVHGGTAHFDEMAACALIMASLHMHEFQIIRRDPTAEELIDASIWKVDVGRVHDLPTLCFDHHQYRGGDSAFVLVAKALNIWEDMLIAYPQMVFKSKLDTEGPNVAAKAIKIDTRALMQTLSPIESAIADMFSNYVVVPDSMRLLLKAIGNTWLMTTRKLIDRLAELERVATFETMPDGNLVIFSPITEEPDFGMAEYRKKYQNATGKLITCSVTPEKRRNEGDVLGLTLYRFNDHPSFDFARLKDLEGVKFAHLEGFIATIEAGRFATQYLQRAFVAPKMCPEAY